MPALPEGAPSARASRPARSGTGCCTTPGCPCRAASAGPTTACWCSGPARRVAACAPAVDGRSAAGRRRAARPARPAAARGARDCPVGDPGPMTPTHYAAVLGAALPDEAARCRPAGGPDPRRDRTSPQATSRPTATSTRRSCCSTSDRISGLLDVDTAGPGRRADDLACLLAHISVLALMRPAHRPRLPRTGAELAAGLRPQRRPGRAAGPRRRRRPVAGDRPAPRAGPGLAGRHPRPAGPRRAVDPQQRAPRRPGGVSAARALACRSGQGARHGAGAGRHRRWSWRSGRRTRVQSRAARGPRSTPPSGRRWRSSARSPRRAWTRRPARASAAWDS